MELYANPRLGSRGFQFSTKRFVKADFFCGLHRVEEPIRFVLQERPNDTKVVLKFCVFEVPHHLDGNTVLQVVSAFIDQEEPGRPKQSR